MGIGKNGSRISHKEYCGCAAHHANNGDCAQYFSIDHQDKQSFYSFYYKIVVVVLMKWKWKEG